MLLHQSFAAAAKSRPHAIALICGARQVTFAELARMSSRIACGLQLRGVQRGDRVAMLLPNGPELVATILGTMQAGGVFVVINPGVKPRKLRHILQDCTPRIFLVDHDTFTEKASESTLAPPTLAPIPIDAVLTDRRVPMDAVAPSLVAASPADLCYLLYTSGSTGNSKGVMMSHENAVTAADAITDYLRLQPTDTVLNFSPLAADYGLYNVLMPLRVGATSMLERSYLLPGQILDAIERERVTGLALVPTIIALFLQTPGLENGDFRSVRFLSSTGQVLPPAHIATLRRIMPQCAIYSMYGLTECKRVSYLDPAEIDHRPTSVGKPLAGTEVWLVDDEGRRIEQPDVVGELVIRGKHVMQGYWNLPDATATCLRPETGCDGDGGNPGKVLYSGDLFRRDADGFLYFVARKDDLISSSGERISPREIEDCIYELPGVTGVVITPVPDDVLGHAIHALVAVAGDNEIDAESVRAHCATHLERALVPHRVEICAAIPQTLTGKLRKRGT